MNWLEDQILTWLQRRCDRRGHPARMVAADILEGTVPNLEVKYCRRCGAVKTDWSPDDPQRKHIAIEHTWRRPDPNLWRG